MSHNDPSSLLEQIVSDLTSLFPFPDSSPASCHSPLEKMQEALRYPLVGGGKHIRPLLVLLTAGAFGGAAGVEAGRKSAMAVELIHTYSLVHDDLPCMDNDDLRRGRPSCHKVYGEAEALLVGDGLLTAAFSTLASSPSSLEAWIPLLVSVLAEAAGPQGMVGGQWLDIFFTGSQQINREQMETLHRKKTGCLLGACLELGLICGYGALTFSSSHNSSDQERKSLLSGLRTRIREAGILTGLAFQVADDILDVTAPTILTGKSSGKDLQQQKMTAVRLLGMEAAHGLVKSLTQNALELLHDVCHDPLLQAETLPSEADSFRQALLSCVESLASRKY